VTAYTWLGDELDTTKNTSQVKRFSEENGDAILKEERHPPSQSCTLANIFLLSMQRPFYLLAMSLLVHNMRMLHGFLTTTSIDTNFCCDTKKRHGDGP
jgi:hypothetical protein